MYTLYWSQNTGALAPQILLEEVGADYQRIIFDLETGEHLKDEYLAINPRGQIPTLVLADGSILTESAAIALHIADSNPDSGLLPPPGSSDRARVYRWLFFAVVNLYEAVLRLYYTDGYLAVAGCEESVQEQARKDLDTYWDQVEKELGDGPYLLGDNYSVTDPYLMMVTQWHEAPEELYQRCPRLGNLCEAVKARPACQSIWNQHFPES